MGDENIESEETSSMWQIQMQTKTKATAKTEKPKQNEAVPDSIRLEGPINVGHLYDCNKFPHTNKFHLLRNNYTNDKLNK